MRIFNPLARFKRDMSGEPGSVAWIGFGYYIAVVVVSLFLFEVAFSIELLLNSFIALLVLFFFARVLSKYC